MRAGKLRHRATIQVLTDGAETPFPSGAPAQTWETFKAGVYCSIEPISGREYFSQQQIQGEVTHRIRIRYLSGITPAMRVLYGARVFVIASPPIDFEERNVEMQLMCIEGPAGG